MAFKARSEEYARWMTERARDIDRDKLPLWPKEGVAQIDFLEDTTEELLTKASWILYELSIRAVEEEEN